MADAATERDEPLRRGDVIWAQLQSVLDENIDKSAFPGGWTGKDVYAHFARWQQISIEQVAEILAGRRPDKPSEDDDTLNNRWHAEDSALTVDEARERCLRSREVHRAQVAALSEDHWRAWGHLFDDVTGAHYAGHLRAAGVEPV